MLGEQVFHDAGLTRTDELALYVDESQNSNNISVIVARTCKTAATNPRPIEQLTAT